jgi:tRNA G18 (ribose-2'-O)-methylase SpoU
VALVAGGGVPIWDLDLGDRVSFVLGAEREGLPVELVESCELVAAIPQAAAAESLNVGIAGAVALYEMRRRARTGGAA